MKSPDEIKKGLVCCVDENAICLGNCVHADNDEVVFPDCIRLLMIDAIGLIEQLEAERDAAVREFAGGNCTQCKWLYSESKDSPCLKCYDNEHWQWRGVTKEN